ncbi:hypothetical protein K9U39_15585 [Rhodoblastus acidophilus]|uniref:Uncharacterized protein n=1 Tax=Candidatus Rhodoblastus alkanivorans TaxID=2954117 RepID=A0ABS9Z2I8_9HYPH|nr:hypothetical protein [Candidatus Rhodoblastus alkanivorans]MCI4678251.1 hypothetical protein [Candidatus Rhodoblastus alkanivorans]MCI4681301.1 hypothetical protein [Candidatus Rhodoblastus alkanivorans]MDI4642348.1 hypothetical protein [Rhodoblastus acidophilus]
MLVLLLVGAPAAASADSCAKFKDADAYNNCLAASGPLFHQGHFTKAPPAVGAKASPPDGAGAPSADNASNAKVWRGRRRPAASPGKHRRRHAAPRKHGRQATHGRVRIEIYPGR